ncbi:hypothetical protein BD626DRAFT_600791, partial [Schizophyllum amplum]
MRWCFEDSSSAPHLLPPTTMNGLPGLFIPLNSAANKLLAVFICGLVIREVASDISRLHPQWDPPVSIVARLVLHSIASWALVLALLQPLHGCALYATAQLTRLCTNRIRSDDAETFAQLLVPSWRTALAWVFVVFASAVSLRTEGTQLVGGSVKAVVDGAKDMVDSQWLPVLGGMWLGATLFALTLSVVAINYGVPGTVHRAMISGPDLEAGVDADEKDAKGGSDEKEEMDLGKKKEDSVEVAGNFKA